MSEFYTYRLKNGIRGVHKQVRSRAAHCALMINAGSRDELPTEHGLAHFVEHALFKGTKRRRAYHINCRLENLGGELNAYTTKEETAVHATFLKSDMSKAAELISDMVFNSTFPERELIKEREVIVDEINTYKDSPMDMIYDTFEDMVFDGSQLGHNILGRKASLNKFTTSRLSAFVERAHTTDQMVFSSIGNITNRQIERIAERYFGDIEPSVREFQREAPTERVKFIFDANKHLHQSHTLIGGRAYSINDPKRLPLSLLINMLGGPSANSMLNVALRERNGLCYNVESTYTPYTDTGIASIYYSCDKERAERCQEIIDKLLLDIKTNSVSERQLSIAKRQFMGQFTISMDSNESNMLGAGKSYMVYNEIDDMEVVFKRVHAVTCKDVQVIANEIFTDNSTLIYK